MASVTKRVLSGSTDGQPITISATNGASATIHTGPSNTSIIDEIYVYAQNNHSHAVELHLEFINSATNTVIIDSIVSRGGPQLVVPGLPVQGNATNNVIYGYILDSSAASQANVHVFGFVNRIDQS